LSKNLKRITALRLGFLTPTMNSVHRNDLFKFQRTKMVRMAGAIGVNMTKYGRVDLFLIEYQRVDETLQRYLFSLTI